MSGMADTEIRIGPDGRIYFSGLPEEMLEIAASLCPEEPGIMRRLELLQQIRSHQTPHQRKEPQDGDSAPGDGD